MKHRQLRDVLSWTGIDPPRDATQRLEQYETWLAEEAVDAGGIAPGDRHDVWLRHVLDACMFGIHLPTSGRVVDVGTGVGLPGVPLAVVAPHLHFDLVDRSGRRTRLVRRVVRILGLENVTVVHGDAFDHSPADGLVMRAALPPDRLSQITSALLAPGGYATVGVGRTPVEIDGWDLVRFPGSEVLAPGRWIRIMRAQ